MIAGFPFASREFVQIPIEIDPTLYHRWVGHVEHRHRVPALLAALWLRRDPEAETLNTAIA